MSEPTDPPTAGARLADTWRMVKQGFRAYGAARKSHWRETAEKHLLPAIEQELHAGVSAALHGLLRLSPLGRHMPPTMTIVQVAPTPAAKEQAG